MIVAENQRRTHTRARRVRRTVDATLVVLKARLAVLDDDIDGPITARTLMAEPPERGHLDRCRLAALVGVAPVNRASRRWRGRRTIAGSRTTVRPCLYMATLVAVRFNPVLKTRHQRLTARSCPKKLALIACLRRLLTILDAIVRTQTPWQDA